jgi:hypothetical protein
MLCKPMIRSLHVMFRGLEMNSHCNYPSDTACYFFGKLPMKGNLLIMIMY